MPRVHDRWTVLPHGPLEPAGEGILTVEGDLRMPLASFPRRMTAVRLASGGSLVFSVMALREPEMAELEAFGRPEVMVVPSPFHRLDARTWKQRYPELRVLAPPGARPRVEQVVKVDSTGDSLGDPAVRFVTVGGTGGKESALIVERERGTTLIVNDIIGHVRHPRSLGAAILARLIGHGVKRPQVPRTVRFLLAEKRALARQLQEFSALPRLERIIMSHGEPVTDDPRGVLERLAGELA